MLEMKITLNVPDLAAAVLKLAEAITPPNPDLLTPDMPRAVGAPPVAPVNPTPAPAATPVNGMPQSAPLPTATPAPAPISPPPVGQMVPATAPTPVVPVAAAPAYNLDQISRAGASLVDAGKMEPLLALLARYGVAAVTQLQPEHYGAFATELRALGAQI